MTATLVPLDAVDLIALISALHTETDRVSTIIENSSHPPALHASAERIRAHNERLVEYLTAALGDTR
jgi:hypothetical protein